MENVTFQDKRTGRAAGVGEVLMPEAAQTVDWKPRIKKPNLDTNSERIKLSDGYRAKHKLVAVWVPSEDFEFLSEQADKHKIGLSAYVRSILVDALQDELFPNLDDKQKSSLASYIRGIVQDELLKV
jgi:hypothetical protein